VTCDGRLFHRRVTTTGNVLSPTADRRVRRTSMQRFCLAEDISRLSTNACMSCGFGFSSPAVTFLLYREISELHKARVTHVSEAQKAALDVEVAAKEQLREALDECKQQAKREKMLQLTQVCDEHMYTHCFSDHFPRGCT